MRRLSLFLVSPVVTALLFVANGPAAAQTAPAIQVPCPAPLRTVAQDGIDVMCNQVAVPAEYSAPDGATVDVLLAVIPGDSAQPPLVLMQGGPGGSTIATVGPLLFVTQAGGQLRAERTVVLFEARGTRYADPFLFCEEDFNTRIQALETLTDATAVTAANQQNNLLACKARLAGQGVDFDWFDHAEVTADVPYAMAALGYSQFDFYGLSYASLTAQHLLRDYQDNVRSVILDGVVPADETIGAQSAQHAERAFAALFAACQADSACNAAHPNLEATFNQTYAELNASPAQITLTAPDGTQYQTLLSGRGFVTALFSLLYNARTNAPALPDIIYEAAAADYSSLVAIADFGYFNRTFANGLQSAVLCSEDGESTVTPSTASAFQESFTAPADYFAICEALNVEPIGVRYDQPVVSAVPALLFSGVFDPVTPPSGGDAVAAALTNASHITFNDGGHTQLFYDTCASSITVQFLNNPGEAVNASCASSAPEFYTDVPRRETVNNIEFNVPGSWISRRYLDPSVFEDGPRVMQVGVAAVPFPELSSGFFSSILGELGNTESIEVSGRTWVVSDYAGADGLGAYYAYTLDNDLTYAVIVQGPQEELDSLYATALLLTLEDFTILGPPQTLLSLQ